MFIFLIILHFYKKIKKIGSIYPHALFWAHAHIFFVIARSQYSERRGNPEPVRQKLKIAVL